MNTVRKLESTDHGHIYEEYSAKIYRYFRYRVRNVWDVEDLTTTVFVKVYSKLDQYDGRHPFGAWIFRIAHNTLIDYLRKKREYPADQEVFSSLVTSEKLPEERVLNQESHEDLWKNVKTLTADQRNVISLRYLADLRMNEIAEILGKTEASVKILHFRGIKKLQKMMSRV
ncbi:MULTISPECIES: sigma-70 family RNA polymerase sigma factor [Brevibacillus]|jgi:RNA polymerase sigma-70 factor (ECF subfamily)|uniref:RNA polymerase ECF-type sigma factor n=1 Tax=Brevibacillus borstelensis AK1 TaxID=1300222 RepID=M8DXX8_9BACL|nr:sigma-70 family RNA polymerase sigma factor [Brevibacillus borstelensis]EMT51881.1 RNA polymerase ECF-type sigma factor [Brevibacillus borstelensis AK1]KKX56053.1 RNA polymerase subunit sigma-24 [Brevibacillus borstelensis cifa_chp40]MBE5398426.1 sigma-70 family RNA polymerase sigma factor [Brevibacillus borstelensis]MCC0565898.1 sigma-70 family RNA polymerase sigma factor [Brevibacillus borstelensis]MCM3471112.1 sigma-70 family RNA polymerase sigma factor [Brevibacillus borstelensis]